MALMLYRPYVSFMLPTAFFSNITFLALSNDQSSTSIHVIFVIFNSLTDDIFVTSLKSTPFHINGTLMRI